MCHLLGKGCSLGSLGCDVSCVFALSHMMPVSGVVFDCIDYRSLSFLLLSDWSNLS